MLTLAMQLLKCCFSVKPHAKKQKIGPSFHSHLAPTPSSPVHHTTSYSTSYYTTNIMLPSIKAHPKAVYEICNTDDDDDAGVHEDGRPNEEVELAPLFGRSPLQAAATSRGPPADHTFTGSKPLLLSQAQHACCRYRTWLVGLLVVAIASGVAWFLLSSPGHASVSESGAVQHASVPCWVVPAHNTSDAIGRSV